MCLILRVSPVFIALRRWHKLIRKRRRNPLLIGLILNGFIKPNKTLIVEVSLRHGRGHRIHGRGHRIPTRFLLENWVRIRAGSGRVFIGA